MIITTQFLISNLKPKGLKIVSVELKENELIVEFRNKQKLVSRLIFRGVIGFKESGSVGKAITDLLFENKGSFKLLRIRNQIGKILLHCECMEASYSATK